VYDGTDAEGPDGDGSDGRIIELENLSWWRFFFHLFFNFKINTENGRKPVLEHLAKPCRRPDEECVYKCVSCGAICCACFGGAPDPRCDNCVAEELSCEEVW
jgi:hypothetical protein